MMGVCQKQSHRMQLLLFYIFQEMSPFTWIIGPTVDDDRFAGFVRNDVSAFLTRVHNPFLYL